MGFCFEVFITLVYWAVLYNLSANRNNRPPLFNNINEHGVPAILLVVEFGLGSHRFTPKHCLLVIVLGLLYALILNMPYSLAVRPVYGLAFDWRSWQTYIFIIINIVVVGLLFLIGRLLFLKCKREKL